MKIIIVVAWMYTVNIIPTISFYHEDTFNLTTDDIFVQLRSKERK